MSETCNPFPPDANLEVTYYLLSAGVALSKIHRQERDQGPQTGIYAEVKGGWVELNDLNLMKGL